MCEDCAPIAAENEELQRQLANVQSQLAWAKPLEGLHL